MLLSDQSNSPQRAHQGETSTVSFIGDLEHVFCTCNITPPPPTPSTLLSFTGTIPVKYIHRNHEYISVSRAHGWILGILRFPLTSDSEVVLGLSSS